MMLRDWFPPQRTRNITPRLLVYADGDTGEELLGGEVAPSPSPSPSPLLTSLVAYWKLDEASSLRFDSAGSNTLADNNTVTQAEGLVGSAAQFTAANLESLNCADNAALSMGDIDFTIAGWVYLDSLSATTTRYLIGKFGGGGARDYAVRLTSTNVFDLTVSNDGTTLTSRIATTFGTPLVATWYFLVCWHDSVANTLNIQVNNGTADSVGYTTGVFDGAASFRMGRRDDGVGELNGRLDEVGIWKRVLTASERTDLYNSGAGMTYPFTGLGGGPTQQITVNSTAFVRAGSANQWYARAAVETVSGVQVLVYKHGSSHANNDGELHIKFSNDYGDTWSAEDKYTDGASVTNFPMNPSGKTAAQDAQEPWLMTAPNGDLLLHMWRSDYGMDFDGTYQSVSSDGGRTWSVAAAISFVGLDGPTNLLTFATDDHFVFDGVIYAAARTFSGVDTDDCKSILVESPDNGVTWTYISTIADTDAVETGLEYLGNNRIIAIMRSVSGLYVWRSFSTDMGATWSAPQDIRAMTWDVERGRILTRTHLEGGADWWLDGYLVMCGFFWDGSARTNAVWLSRDGGMNWTLPQAVDVTAADAGYGDLFYRPATGEYVFVSYQGATTNADVKQYALTVNW